MNGAIPDRLDRAMDERVFPGCVLGITADSGTEVHATGRLTYDISSPRVTESTTYDIASVTKAIPVSCLALAFIERKRIALFDPVIDYLPEFTGTFREEIRIIHLLTHTLDFDFRLSELKDLPAGELLARILSAPLKSPPGEKFCYANATSILLGMVLERAAGTTLDKAARDTFFGPLTMTSTTFFPDQHSLQNVAPTEDDPWRARVIRGEVHDESAWALRPLGAVGSAGLFSTVPDLLIFVRMLLDRGIHDGTRFFTEDSIAMMHANRRPVSSGEFTGLGWELNQRQFMGTRCGPDTFGKTGFTGCAVVIDPSCEKGFVLLSNHTYPHRQTTRDAINSVRRDIADLVFGVDRKEYICKHYE